MSKLCLKCQYLVGAPLLSSTALILLCMEFTRAAQVFAGILFHSSIMTSRSCWMLDTLCFFTFRLRIPHMCLTGFRSGDILGHSITFTFSSKAGVFGVVVMLENCFWREGIIFCFRMSQYTLESMFPSMNRSFPVPAVVMQPKTMMLPPPCLTVGKAQFSWYSSPGCCHTCWTPSESNKFTLDSSDYRTWFKWFMLFARLSLANYLQAFLWASFRRGFLLGWWPCKPTCCSVWHMVWALTSWPSTSGTSKTMLAALMRLFFEASFCTWRTA